MHKSIKKSVINCYQRRVLSVAGFMVVEATLKQTQVYGNCLSFSLKITRKNAVIKIFMVLKVKFFHISQAKVFKIQMKFSILSQNP